MNTAPRQSIDLERLKEVVGITDLAASLGLEMRGRQARCFNAKEHKHGDRNFSLGLDVSRNRFKCFTCGVSGSVIDLYKEVRGVELSDAIKELADTAGLQPAGQQTHRTAPSGAFRVKNAPSEPADAYSDVYEELATFCKGIDQESRGYLTGAARGLSDETISRFVPFSVADYQATDAHLKAKFDAEMLKRAGVMGEKGNLIFYKHKIVIPFLSEGRIIFLQGRRLDNDNPKYLHISRPVPLFNTDALDGMKRGDTVFICEGVFDAMMLEQNGYRAVAILGVNNFKPDFVDLFRGLDVVLCLDNDDAGKRATDELAKMFLQKGQAVKTKCLPDGIKDMTEYFINLPKL